MLESGWSLSTIARHFNVAVSTVHRLRERVNTTGVTDDRPRSGAPRVTTPNQDRHIRLQHLRHRLQSATRTAAETPGLRNRRISGQTVRNRLREHGLRARRPYCGPVLNHHRRATRLQWVTTRVRWPAQRWRSVLFTDESRFCVSFADGRRRVWRRPGERYANCCVLERDRWGGGSLMVWAGIHSAGKTPLLFIQGNLTARRYVDEVLRPVVVPYTRQYDLTLQQDNARPHAARYTQAFLTQEGVDVMPWPPYSPDLSPIEHLWDLLDRQVRSRDPPPGNLQQLRQALQEEWNSIGQPRIRRLVSSMRRRCVAVRDARGGHTRY